MTNYLRQLSAGLRVALAMTMLLGVLYPAAVWAATRLPGLYDNAEGSLVESNGRAVGSDLIGVDPVAEDPRHDPWFHTRPSALSEDVLGPADTSGSVGSNKGAFDADLVAAIKERKAAIAQREGVAQAAVPPDAVTASASGLDPHISPAYAALQVGRVAAENDLSENAVRRLVADNTDGRGMGVLGEPRVNVLELNLAVRAAK